MAYWGSVSLTTGLPPLKSTTEKKLDVFAAEFVVSIDLMVSVGESFSLLAPGALKLGEPNALSNRVESLSAVTIDSFVMKPTVRSSGVLLYFDTTTV